MKKYTSVILSIFLILNLFGSITIALSNNPIYEKQSVRSNTQIKDILSNNFEKKVEYLYYTFCFNKPELQNKNIDNKSYTELTMPDTLNLGKKAGNPTLPIKLIKILLPPKSTISSIRVIGEPEEIVLKGINLKDSPIFPYQNPVPIGDNESQTITSNKKAYVSTNKYPSEIYGQEHIGYCRGYTILSLALNPVQYIPHTGRLFYYPQMELKITVEDADEINQFYRNNNNDEDWVKKLVYNPEIIQLYSQMNLHQKEYSGGLCEPTDDYDYVILTTTHKHLDHWVTSESIPYNWTSLINKHTTDDKLNCTLVTIQDINTCPTYWNTNPLFNDTTAHIREFCKDAYQDWNTEYVLIGGDDEWIPARHMKYDYEGNVDSDIYWSNLDNSFNDDNDGYWGEEDDSGFDLYAELFIGRLPCDEPQDVSNWMKKSFYYTNSNEKNYLDNAAFYGGDSTWECEGDDIVEYSAIKGTNDFFGPIPHVEGPYPTWLGFQYGFKTWNNENYWKAFNLSEKWTGEPPNPGWQGGDENAAISGMRNAINNDQCTLITAIAHANEEMSMDVTCHEWETHYHNTKPFFITDQGCHCGDMDAAEDGVLHSMLFHSDTELAFACVYNTGYGWGNYYSTNASSAVQQKCFWDYLFDVENNSGAIDYWQLGKAMAWSKDMMAPTIDWDPGLGTWRGVIQCCTLFGDPAQCIKPPITPEHNVGVMPLNLSGHMKYEVKIPINTIIFNDGQHDETNVYVNFSVDGQQLNSITIPLFKNQTSEFVNFSWMPSHPDTYTLNINVTISNTCEDLYEDNTINHTIILGVLNSDTGKLFSTIQEAIDDPYTISGHNILVPSGIYTESVVINKGISLNGANKTSILQGAIPLEKIVHITNTHSVIINGFSIMNNLYGIFVEMSSNVVIRDNDILYNENGIMIDAGSYENILYHNTLNNTFNAFDEGTNNQWNYDYYNGFRPYGGNYWSDYHDEDVMSGPYQNIFGSDGIGDLPYAITGGSSQDVYPLIHPWTGPLPGTIYVDDDNTNGPWKGTQTYPIQYIQDAIDLSLDGDTIFICEGIYHEHITIEKTIKIIGDGRYNVIIDGDNIGNVIEIMADNVTIQELTVKKSGSSDFPHWNAGIYVLSGYTQIRNTIIIDNPDTGIFVDVYCDYNNISNNVVDNSGEEGIFLRYSSNNIIFNNSVINSAHHGIYLFLYCHNSIISNNVLSDNGCGIEQYASYNTIITCNKIVNNRNLGVYNYINCFNAVISDNLIQNNGVAGIVVQQDCDDIIISNNIIDTQTIGIVVDVWSDNGCILSNIITNHGFSGLELTDGADYFTITDNFFKNNANGIYVESGSNNNCLLGNTFINNQRGIYLKATQNYVIYHNNFINNDQHAYDRNSNNKWYNETIQEGNYWDNYTGIDQDEDCIGDTPFIISNGNIIDQYPFIYKNGWNKLYWWPMFHRNPTHTGYSTTTAPDTNHLDWSKKITGYNEFLEASPAVAYGNVYIGSRTGFNYTMFCFDAETGATIWTHSIADALGGSYCSPAVVDEKIYIGIVTRLNLGIGGKLLCLDALGNNDGTTTEIWNTTIIGPTFSSPTVIDGKLYIGSHDNYVYCFDADPYDDGVDEGVDDPLEALYDLLWSFQTNERITASPTVFNNRIYVGSLDGKMYCLNAQDGSYNWSFQTGGPISYSSVGVEHRLYFGSWDNNIYCVNATNGAYIWQCTTGDKILSSPAIAYNNIYVGSYDNTVYCLPQVDPNTDGVINSTEIIWTYETGKRVFASPAVADGNIYVGSRDGTFYCFNATIGDPIWKYSTWAPYPFDGIGSSAAIVDGNVYVASTDGYLYSFGNTFL